MKLQTKFALILLGLSLIMSVGLIVPGYLKLRGFESQDANQYLQNLVRDLVRESDRSMQTLKTAGVAEIESYVSAGKLKVLERIDTLQRSSKAKIRVFDQNDKLISEDSPGQYHISQLLLSPTILQQAYGLDTITNNGDQWRIAFAKHNQWNWTMTAAMSDSDVFRESNAYLFFVLRVGLITLLVILLIYQLLTRQVGHRLNAIFEHLRLYKKGQFNELMETRHSDEIGVLTSGINDMMTSIKTEINTRKNAEISLASAKEEADKANRAKSEFLANMSHEIRNPLNSIVGFTELLSKTNLNHEQTGYLEYLTHANQSLTKTIDDILNLTKIERGIIEISSDPFELREEVEATFGLFALAGRNKGIDMICSIHPDVPSKIYGDRNRWSEIISNLVSNAVKYTDQGEIKLILEPCVTSAQELKLSVTDSGIGITKEEQNKIFTPFSRAHSDFNGDSEKNLGSGLGLSIIQRLVELMEGEIELISTPGEGSTFTVNLPFINASPEDANTEFSETVSQFLRPGIKALVADDDILNKSYVGETLRKNGIAATLVDDGEQAIEKLKTDLFDIILLDIRMPLVSGVEVMKFVRNELDSPARETPIIALTANVYESDIETYYSAGANFYLSKPFRPNQLLETIGQILESQAVRTSQAS